VVLVDAYETALETSAHPAIIKKVRPVRTSTNFPANLCILFNMLPPCFEPKVDQPNPRSGSMSAITSDGLPTDIRRV
jgi:hypothetical protein